MKKLLSLLLISVPIVSTSSAIVSCKSNHQYSLATAVAKINNYKDKELDPATIIDGTIANKEGEVDLSVKDNYDRLCKAFNLNEGELKFVVNITDAEHEGYSINNNNDPDGKLISDMTEKIYVELSDGSTTSIAAGFIKWTDPAADDVTVKSVKDKITSGEPLNVESPSTTGDTFDLTDIDNKAAVLAALNLNSKEQKFVKELSTETDSILKDKIQDSVTFTMDDDSTVSIKVTWNDTKTDPMTLVEETKAKIENFEGNIPSLGYNISGETNDPKVKDSILSNIDLTDEEKAIVTISKATISGVPIDVTFTIQAATNVETCTRKVVKLQSAKGEVSIGENYIAGATLAYNKYYAFSSSNKAALFVADRDKADFAKVVIPDSPDSHLLSEGIITKLTTFKNELYISASTGIFEMDKDGTFHLIKGSDTIGGWTNFAVTKDYLYAISSKATKNIYYIKTPSSTIKPVGGNTDSDIIGIVSGSSSSPDTNNEIFAIDNNKIYKVNSIDFKIDEYAKLPESKEESGKVQPSAITSDNNGIVYIGTKTGEIVKVTSSHDATVIAGKHEDATEIKTILYYNGRLKILFSTSTGNIYDYSLASNKYGTTVGTGHVGAVEYVVQNNLWYSWNEQLGIKFIFEQKKG